MRVLVACEYSGRVREAFAKLDHDAWSCDLLPTEQPGNHIQGDVRDILDDGWDLMIAHPPCTYLASSGARWWKDRLHLQQEAADFAYTLISADIPHIAMENPRGALSRLLWAPDQEVQPWWFGEPESKLTCFWLENLKPLKATNILCELDVKASVHHEPPGPDRWKNRSRTFQGIANAMADQWGRL